MDKHLEFYFSRKKNKRILQQNRIINRRNYIIDKSLTKKLVTGEVNFTNTNFKIKKKVTRRISVEDNKRCKTLKNDSMGRMVDK